MKYFIIFLLVVTNLFGSFDDLKNEFYQNYSPKHLNSFVNEEGDFNKSEYQLFEKNVITYFKQKNFNKIQIDRLNKNIIEKRIDANIKQGNKIAVYRDIYRLKDNTLLNTYANYINNINIFLMKNNQEGINSILKKISLFEDMTFPKGYKEIEAKELFFDQNRSGKVYNNFKKAYLNYYINMAFYDLLIKIFSEHKDDIIDNFAFLTMEIMVEKINNITVIKEINLYLNHYVNTTLGSLFIAIILFFFIMGLKFILIPFLTRQSERIFSKKEDNSQKFHIYIKQSVTTPVQVFLYVLAFHMAIKVLAEDAFLKNWHIIFDSGYIIAFSLLFYKLVNNIIVYFTEDIFVKYPNVRKELINMIMNLFNVLIWIVAIAVLLHRNGVDITTFVASLGIGGLAIALGLKDTLANIFGAIGMILDNAISQGNWIKLPSGKEGTVIEFGIRTTKIRTFYNALLIVPNSKLAGAEIENFSKRKFGRRIKTKIQIAYGAKPESLRNTVKEIKEMLMRHPGIANPSDYSEMENNKMKRMVSRDDAKGYKRIQLVYFDEFNESSIDILIYCFSRTVVWEEWLEVKEDVYYKIWEIVENNGLEFAFNTMTLYHNKGKDFSDIFPNLDN